jgi:hypothetical protein
MSYAHQNAVQGVYGSSVEARARFVMRTYGHLLGAMLAFTALEVFFFQTGIANSVLQVVANTGWMLIMGGFIVVSWIATHFAHTARSKGAQYAALGGFVLAEAIIFVPLLAMAQITAPGTIQSAATVTLMGFGGLTGIAFWTRKDFSFLGGILKWAFMMALVAIVASLIFGFQLGTFFSVAMVGLAGAAILWDTSNVLHHYPEDRYVGAALQLFASVAMMFWYVLRIFMSRD